MWDVSDLQARRRVVLLFALMVLLPAAIFGILIVRAVRSDRVHAAQEKSERQRHIARLCEDDLSSWLFSTQPDAAISKSLFRFRLEGDRIVFPGFQLTLPLTETAARPPSPTPPPDRPTAQVITDFYYPRFMVFLRDFKSGAQYFLRLRSLLVLLPGSNLGYALDAEQIIDRANERLA